MPRIFGCLSIGQFIVLAGTFGLGLLSPAWAGLRDRHVVLALFALLLACLVQVIAFTYLTVTGKMIGQAVHLAGLPLDHVYVAKDIKRRMTRLLGTIVAACVLTAATGGRRWRMGSDASVHLMAALVLLAAQAMAMLWQYLVVRENAELVDRVLREYNVRRAGQKRSPDPGAGSGGGGGLRQANVPVGSFPCGASRGSPTSASCADRVRQSPKE